VVLLGNSRGGNAVRNYVQNGGGAAVVSHAMLGGVPNARHLGRCPRLPAGTASSIGTVGPFLQAA
jgi:triacylglycerol lipase